MPRHRRARTWASASPRRAATRQALARALRDHDDIDTALKAYNAERQPYGNNVVMHGRKLGTHLGVNLKTEEDRRMHDAVAERRAARWTGSRCRISWTPTNERAHSLAYARLSDLQPALALATTASDTSKLA